MSNTKYPALIFYTIIIVALVLPAFYFSRLPETVASHFNIINEPDAWMSKKTFLFVHVGIIIFMSVLFWGIPHMLPKLPKSIINLPNKDYWMSEKNIEETFAVFKRFFFWFGSLTIVFITVIFQEVYNTNIADNKKLTSNVWIYLAVFLLATVFLIIKLITFFKRTDNTN